MPVHVALLRAINVGGRNLVPMSGLRELLEGLGFAGARSLLQSGNLVFQSGRRQGTNLERLLEVETEKRFKAAADYLVRSADEWDTIVADNPFPKEAERDPGHLLVMCLKKAPEASDVKALEAAIKGPEIVRAEGKQLYLVYPAGIGTSKLTNTLIEKKLGTRGTGRNWNTVLKLGALARDLAGASE
jgi:uncharacterized protein (DUF1697 family)